MGMTNRDYTSDNGDFAKGTLYMIKGAPINKTALMPTSVITGHSSARWSKEIHNKAGEQAVLICGIKDQLS